MESLFHIKCHRIIDHHKVEVAVVIVDCILTSMDSVVYIEQEVLKIPMFVTSGEKDTLKGNGFNNFK